MRRKDYKKSIAGNLSIRMAGVLAAALMLLLAASLFVLKHEVRREGEHYAKALVAIYSDLIIYESDHLGKPADMSFSDRYTFFGNYLCSWYRVDYAYAYVPDIGNDEVTLVSVARNSEKYGDKSEDHMTGVTRHHALTADEARVWNGDEVYAVVDRDWFDDMSQDVVFLLADNYGNKSLAGIRVSMEKLYGEMMLSFGLIALFMLFIVLLMAGLLHHFIRKKVSEPAHHLSQAMKDYVAGSEFNTAGFDIEGKDEFSMMTRSFRNMTVEMNRYIGDLDRLDRERERQQAEVDIASSIQKGILPDGSASFGNCGIKAVMKPAKYIGGDLYDYLELDEHHTMIVVADVSGKGIPSAMLMALALAHIRQFAKMGYSPAGILENTNDIFSDENPQMMFVTAFVAIYDSADGTLTYANAGHNPPYLIHDSLEMLTGSDGTPLGLFPGEEYTDVTVRMEVGDSLFLYTDGVNEAVNTAGEFYGTERLESVLTEAAASRDKDYLQAVGASMKAFSGGAEQNDDITMLVLYARPNPVLELDYDIEQFELIRKRLFESRLPHDLAMSLCLAAEECFVNICSYAFDGPAPEGEKIRFYFEYSNKVVMRFVDGGRQFDPRNGLPDTDVYDVDAAVGGLGRLIAFTIADTVDYEYRDGMNILTITKLKNA